MVTYANLTGMPLLGIGSPMRNGVPVVAALSNTTLDAALESVQLIGHVWWADRASHTIDTTGSSSIQWRTSTVTFANGSTTFTVGIAAVDATAGPPVRAVNVADAITFDVGVTYTAPTGVTTAAWQTSVPTAGTKTIGNGDLVAVCMQMVTRGGADSVLVSDGGNNFQNFARPSVTSFTGAAYANANHDPCVVLVASDGTLGYLMGSYVCSVGLGTTTWNSGSGTVEYGNLLQFPVPVRIAGFIHNLSVTADCDLVMYTDPLGTPAAARTVSLDLNQVSATAVPGYIMFTSAQGPYDLAANTPVGVIAKPGGSNVALTFLTLNASAHQTAHSGNGYAINRASGAFAAQNSSKDRYTIGLLLDGFSDGTGTGGAGPMMNPSLEGL